MRVDDHPTLSLPLKFTLILSGALTALMLVTGIVIYRTGADALDRAIDEFGANLVQAMATTEISCRHPDHGTLQTEFHRKLEALRAQFPLWLQVIARAAAGPRSPGDSNPAVEQKEAWDQEVRQLNAEDNARRAANLQRIKDLLEYQGLGGKRAWSEVVDAFVNDAQGQTVMRSGEVAFHKMQEERFHFVEDSGKSEVPTETRIARGRYQRGDVRGAGRLYSHPVVGNEGQRVGTAYVILSEQRIDERQNQLLASILGSVLAVLAAGIAVAFLVTRQLLRPLKRLVHDMEEVSHGNLEHRTEAHSKDEIGVLAVTFDRMTQNLLVAQEERMKLLAKEHEVKIAAEMHRRLLPAGVPVIPGYELEASFRQGTTLSGNYYDFLSLPGGRSGILVANVAGEGVPALMIMTMTRSLIAGASGQESSPAALLSRVNAALARDIRKGMSVTLLMVVLDPASAEVVVACSGHLPLLHWQRRSNEVSAVQPTGIALGLDPGPVYQRTLQEERLELEVGDRLVLFTDGVFTMKNRAGEEFGDRSFYELVRKEAPKNTAAFINFVERTLERFREGAQAQSDFTIVTLRRARPEGEPGSGIRSAPA